MLTMQAMLEDVQGSMLAVLDRREVMAVLGDKELLLKQGEDMQVDVLLLLVRLLREIVWLFMELVWLFTEMAWLFREVLWLIRGTVGGVLVDVLLNFLLVLTGLSLSNFLFSDFRPLISDFKVLIVS